MSVLNVTTLTHDGATYYLRMDIATQFVNPGEWERQKFVVAGQRRCPDTMNHEQHEYQQDHVRESSRAHRKGVESRQISKIRVVVREEKLKGSTRSRRSRSGR